MNKRERNYLQHTKYMNKAIKSYIRASMKGWDNLFAKNIALLDSINKNNQS